MTDYFAQGIGSFYFHKQSLAEGGYNYYGRIHRSGRVLVMRQEVSSENALYADGGWDFDTAWTGRTSLTYKQINLL